MALSVDTTPAKHVTVLRNGDNKYEGRKFVVSRRRYRTFDSLLADITHQIGAPFGAVRRLYTPKGSRQIRDVDDLEGGGTYVAGGSERFKKINYNSTLQSPEKHWGFFAAVKPGFLADDPPPLVLPKKNKKYAQRSAQFHKVRQPVQFTVFRNGLISDKGTRFLLKAREMKSFETVLSIISFKIRLVEGAVRRLYTIEGSVLNRPEEIRDGGQYVACGHRRFIAVPYGELPSPVKAQKLPSIKRRRHLNHQSPRTQSNPLPAIQQKATEKKARSEKDSPAPIEEHAKDEKEKESTIPDLLAEEVNGVPEEVNGVPEEVNNVPEEDISRTEVRTVSNKSISKLPVLKKRSQANSPDDTSSVPSKSKLDRNPPKKQSNPELLTNTEHDDSLFNASSAAAEKPANQDGQFLMNNDHGDASKDSVDVDEVEEDRNLVEDKPIDLQQAEEVPDEEVDTPNPKPVSRGKE